MDPTKRYRLSGCFKSVGAGGLSKAYFGYDPRDKSNRQITSSMSDYYVNRNTTLAQPLNPGDTIAYLTSVANYATSTPTLQVYPFENYPEYTYTRNQYTYSTINPVDNSLTLNSVYSGSALPAGTKVSQAKSAYGSYMYSVLSNQTIPNT